MNNTPIVSVIIPVYNTSQFLKRCLDSVINQTYKNLQIICVNDASPDDSLSILQEYCEQDNRIIIVNNAKNLGLYHARLEGIKIATGEFIACLDSDDYISSDYYRCLVDKALETDADIVFSKLIHEDDTGYRFIHNIYHYLSFDNQSKKPLDCYLEQEGRCFVWHTVWNKLYKKSLWDKALPYLCQQTKHLIMTEDFVFSSVLFYFAQKISSVEYSYHFYYQHKGASTSANGNYNKYYKNVSDLICAFDFVEKFFNSKKLNEQHMQKFIRWRELYSRFWHDNIKNADISRFQKHELLNMLERGLKVDQLRPTIPSDHYFYSITTKWDSRYYELQEYLIRSEKKYYSFDIFDTAIVRPFLEPTDLFHMMEKDFKSSFKSNLAFANIRIKAEQYARAKKAPVEITIDEIYDEMSSIFGLDRKNLESIKQREIWLEIQLSKKRESIYNLYKMLVSLNKAVIFISDMYLSKQTVKQILENNGYKSYEEIYISSEIGASKYVGDLYQVVADDLIVEGSSIFHIGDNWETDCINAKNANLETHFYPKAKDVFKNSFPNIHNTEVFNDYFKPSNSWLNVEKSYRFLEVRCALALCANKLCDNPYDPYKEGSSFNSNSQFVGYFPVGMFLLGVTQWIHKNRVQYNNIHFIGRDGYLFQKAYELMYNEHTNYVELSRKALLPLAVNSSSDIYSLSKYLYWNKTTPRKVLNALKYIINVDETVFNGYKLDERFESENKYLEFLNIIVDKLYDENKKNNYQDLMRKYFSCIFDEHDVLFDVGYSGRSQLLISNLLGYPLDGLYIHINDDENLYAQKLFGITIQSYYGFTPSVTGSQREYLFSKQAGSLLEFRPNGDNVELINEDYNNSYADVYCIKEIQNEALQFVSDFSQTFSDYLDIMSCRNLDIAIPFEKLIHNSYEDLNIFKACIFEDELFDGRKEINLCDIWRRDIDYHYPKQNIITKKVITNNPLFDKFSSLKRWKKAIIYMFCDFSLFKSKVKNKLKRK